MNLFFFFGTLHIKTTVQKVQYGLFILVSLTNSSEGSCDKTCVCSYSVSVTQSSQWRYPLLDDIIFQDDAKTFWQAPSWRSSSSPPPCSPWRPATRAATARRSSPPSLRDSRLRRALPLNRQLFSHQSMCVLVKMIVANNLRFCERLQHAKVGKGGLGKCWQRMARGGGVRKMWRIAGGG